MKHDVHLKLKIDGGKTDFDGVFATQKHSTCSIEKSKISPLMNNIPMVIDITKGGIVNQSASLVEWVTMINPAVFKQASWWEVESWAYDRWKPYWEKFYQNGFAPKFRQASLYSYASTHPDFQLFLRLIWVTLISERYTLQSEVCKHIKTEFEDTLKDHLRLTDQEILTSSMVETKNFNTIDEETGEVIDMVDRGNK